MKNYKISRYVILIVIVILVIIGAKYYFLGPNLGCSPDSQGIKSYILKSNLVSYGNLSRNNDGSQFLNDSNIFERIRNDASVYAQDTNNCYGKHTYKVKKENILTVVSQREFNDYLISEKFNKNFCESAVQLIQSGNSPVFVKDKFCTI